MATAEFKATMDSAGTARGAASNLVGASVAANATAASNGTHGAAFTAALAVLVADGASPTQAHVTTCNSAWTTYKADIDAATTAAAAITSDVSVFIGSTTNVSTKNKLRCALEAILRTVLASNLLAD